MTMGREDLIAGGADAGLTAGVGAQPQQAQNPQLQILQHILASGMLGPQGGNIGQPHFGGQPNTPQAPARLQTPDIQFSRPTGSFATVGERQRADRQAMIGGIANTVKSASNYIIEKQQRSMQMNTERLMSAYQGLEEAKASGDKEAFQKNTEIINTMLDPTTSDGKKRIKEFQKVFNVNILGDHKDKDSTEYKGFISAVQAFKQNPKQGQLNPVAEKAMGQMPQRLQADPRLQALIEATKAGVIAPQADQIKAQTDLVKIFTAAQEKGYDRASRENIAHYLGDVRDRATQASIIRQMMANKGREGVAELVANASRYRADKAYDAVMNNPRWQILRDKVGKDDSDKSLKTFSDAIDKQMKDLEKNKDQVDKAIAADDKRADAHWWRSKNGELLKQQESINKQIATLQARQKSVIEYYMQQHGDLDAATAPATDDPNDVGANQDVTPEEQNMLNGILNFDNMN